ncbi:MAG: transposase [Rhodospirillales bacterium]|nr:transposase [Rhodospirillales bacterium]
MPRSRATTCTSRVQSDPARGKLTQGLTLGADAFILRFLLHLLPRGFHRIRHYGLLAGSA